VLVSQLLDDELSFSVAFTAVITSILYGFGLLLAMLAAGI
jgi:hypothetical protein